jgi:signal transduction histidine kinase
MAMESVLINLIDNALKYGDGTTVNINLEKQAKGNSVLLSIADQGPGVSDEEKEKIFERFYRIGNEEVRKTKGTGIGLYLVKLLVESHQGTVKVSNNNPAGALFCVTIPVTKR